MNDTETAPRIVVVGSINLDYVVCGPRLPRPGETVTGTGFSEIPGGKGANQAVAAARLGAEVHLVGRLGDDAAGHTLRRSLEQNGIHCEGVLSTADCTSGIAVVTVDEQGENAISVIPGANGRLQPGDIHAATDTLARGRVLLLQLEVPVNAVLAAIAIARDGRGLHPARSCSCHRRAPRCPARRRPALSQRV